MIHSPKKFPRFRTIVISAFGLAMGFSASGLVRLVQVDVERVGDFDGIRISTAAACSGVVLLRDVGGKFALCCFTVASNASSAKDFWPSRMIQSRCRSLAFWSLSRGDDVGAAVPTIVAFSNSSIA